TGNSEKARITVEGRFGLGNATPNFPLQFANVAGDKIGFYGQSGAHYGIGIGNSSLQIHTDTVNSDILFGYGNSATFTENVRVKGTGQVQIGTGTSTDKLNVGGSIRVAGSSAGYNIADAANTLRGTL